MEKQLDVSVEIMQKLAEINELMDKSDLGFLFVVGEMKGQMWNCTTNLSEVGVLLACKAVISADRKGGS